MYGICSYGYIIDSNGRVIFITPPQPAGPSLLNNTEPIPGWCVR